MPPQAKSHTQKSGPPELLAYSILCSYVSWVQALILITFTLQVSNNFDHTRMTISTLDNPKFLKMLDNHKSNAQQIYQLKKSLISLIVQTLSNLLNPDYNLHLKIFLSR